jgi:hypothetical protein
LSGTPRLVDDGNGFDFGLGVRRKGIPGIVVQGKIKSSSMI